MKRWFVGVYSDAGGSAQRRICYLGTGSWWYFDRIEEPNWDWENMLEHSFSTKHAAEEVSRTYSLYTSSWVVGVEVDLDD